MDKKIFKINMIEVSIRNNKPNCRYFLLEPKSIKLSKDSLVYILTGEEKISFINEKGIQATNVGYWIVETERNSGKYVNLLHFDNEFDFEKL